MLKSAIDVRRKGRCIKDPETAKRYNAECERIGLLIEGAQQRDPGINYVEYFEKVDGPFGEICEMTRYRLKELGYEIHNMTEEGKNDNKPWNIIRW